MLNRLRALCRQQLLWLRRAYRLIGMHTAPPGTLLFVIHTRARALLYLALRPYVTGSLHARARFGGTPFYDIARMRSIRQVDGLALVFFCGVGDYLLATPAIQALRLAHPGLPIYAFAGETTDAVNSGLVASLLRCNRHIDAVFTYRGRPRGHWMNYDISDCLRSVPENALILPVVYGTEPTVAHRVTALFETFGLPVTLPVPAPVLDAAPLSAAGQAMAQQIRAAVRGAPRGVVCCHFGTRSSDYVYPHADALIGTLLRAGFAVVSFTPTGLADPALVGVDVTAITPADTIGLLRGLRGETDALFVISVNSLFWPLSSGLDIANLGMHIFHDESLHHYVYPNIFVLTQHDYPRVSPSRRFLAPEGGYTDRTVRPGVTVTDFDAGLVFDCFLRMTDITAAARTGPTRRG